MNDNINILSRQYPQGAIRFTRDETALALVALKSYPKFRSLAAFHLSCLRSPAVIFIYKNCPDAKQSVINFIQELGLERVLIRSELPGGKLGSQSLQGVSADDAWALSEKMLSSENSLMVAIQGAGDIFHNYYNINLEISPYQPGRHIFEIAGPGFTASDINRHGILHERVSVPSYIGQICERLVRREFMITPEGYSSQRNKKIEKYGSQKLHTERATILDYSCYLPIPTYLLQDLEFNKEAIVQVIDNLGYSDTGAIVSLSYLIHTSGLLDLNFWDVHPLSERQGI